jgi:hypothetical protein
MIEPKEISIEGKTYIISKFNYEDGREIVSQYIASALPKIGDYQRNKELVRMMMKYVAIPTADPNRPLILSTPELMNNHIPDWEIGIRLEGEMMAYNCRFFQSGRLSTFLDDIAQNIPQWILKTSTQLSELFSQKEKQL